MREKYGKIQPIEATNFIEQIINEDIEAGRVEEIQTPVPARTQRVSAHRPRQEQLGQFRNGFKNTAASATCFLTTPTRPRKRRNLWTRSAATSNGWAITGRKKVYASDFFDVIYDYAEKLIADGKAFVCDLSPEEISATRGTLDRAGAGEPVPQPFGGGESETLPRNAGGKICGRREVPAREDRYGFAQHEPARPGHLPDSALYPSPHGGQVVHLSDVRLCPPHLRLYAGGDAFALHAGI